MFKRVLSLMLCLCILMSNMPTWSIALAEEELIVEEIIVSETEPEPEPEPEPEVKPEPEPKPEKPAVIEEPAKTEKVVEETAEEETEEPELEVVEAPVLADAPRFVNGYVSIDEGVTVYADADLNEKLGVFGEDAVVYVSNRENTEDEDQDILTLRFACGDELVKAYVKAKNVTPLTSEQREAYVAQAAGGVAYKSGVNLLSVEFLMEEKPTESPEVSPAAEEETEPVEEATDGEAEPAAESESEPEEGEQKTVENEATASEPEEQMTDENEATASEPDEQKSGEQEATASEPEEQEDGVELTAEDCEHSEKLMSETLKFTEITSSDENFHYGIASVTTLTYCKDCGESFGQETLENVERSEEHSYVNHICKACGCNNCAHENLRSGADVEWIGSPAPVTNDCTKHTGSAMVTLYTICAECETVIERGAAQQEDAYAQAHHFEAGEQNCAYCGIAFCAHEGLDNVQLLYDKIGVAQSDEADKHVVTKAEYRYAACEVCDGYIKTATGNTVTELVKHEYVNDVCACGAQSVCQHPNKTSEVYYELVGEIVANDDGLTHTGVYDEYVEYTCPDCNEEFKPELTADDVTKTFSHEYLNDMCWECGYELQENGEATPSEPEVKPEEENKPEAEATPSEPEVEPEVKPEEENKPEAEATPSEPEVKPEEENEPEIEATPSEPANAKGTEATPDEPEACQHPNLTTEEHDELVGEATDNGATHTGVYDRYLLKDCPDCEMVFEPELLEAGAELEKAHAFVDGVCEVCSAAEITWKSAPRLTSVKQNATTGTLILTWESDIAAPSYYVYEVVDGALKGRKASTTNTVTLTGVALGVHTYVVKPRKQVNGAWTYGEASNEMSIRVQNQNWRKAPTISAATQLKTDEGTVKLTWKPIVAAESYLIYVDNKTTPVASTTGTTITLTGLTAAKHTFYVRPYQLDSNHVPMYGNFSAAKTLTVAALWKTKPTISTATQLKTEEGLVKLTWKPGWTGTQAHAIFVDGKAQPAVIVEEGATSAEVSGLTAASHSFTIKPAKFNETTQAWQYGTVSAAKTLTVAALWKTKPTISTVKQTSEGEVTITWKAGSVHTPAFAIFDAFAGGTATRVARETIENIDYDEATKTYSYVLTDVKAGSHVYDVRPVKLNESTNAWAAGTKSATKSLTVAELWKTKPTISSAAQTDAGEVTIKWKAGSVHTPAFAIFDAHDGKAAARVARDFIENFEYDEATKIYTLVLTGVKTGTHVYDVRPVKQNASTGAWTAGTKSATKSVTVKAVTWQTAPTLTLTQLKTAEGAVKMTWTQLVPADGYRIYEVVTANGKTTYNKIDDVQNGKMEYVIEGATAAAHTYCVRPMKRNEDGTWTTGNSASYAAPARKSITVLPLWRTKPTGLTAVQDPEAENTVLLSWTAGSEFTEGYRIYDTFNSKQTLVATITDGSTSTTLTDVALGKHSYTVRPGNLNDNGTFTWAAAAYASAAKALTVATLWNAKPTALTAVQEKGVEGTVTLTWKAGSEMTDGFRVYDTFNGKQSLVATITEKTESVTLTGVAAGTHSYTVRPGMVSDAGVWTWAAAAKASAAKQLTVKNWWSQKPTALKAVQDTAVENKVLLTWTAGSELTDGYRIYDTVSGTATLIATIKEPTTSYELTGVKTGAHSYTVRPGMLNEETGAWTWGAATTASAASALTVKVLWSQKPTITAAKQTANGEVTISWKSGSELTPAFAIYDAHDGKAAARVARKTIDNIDYDEETKTYTYVLTGVKTGSHVYDVRPVKLNESTNAWSTGTKSETKTVNVVSSTWNQAPTLKASQTGLAQVRLSWTHLEPSEAYVVYELIGTEYVQLGEMVLSDSVVIDDVATGTHTYTVRPAQSDENGAYQYGTMSKAVSISAIGVDAAVVTGMDATFVNDETTLTWNAAPYAAAYSVHVVGEDAARVTVSETSAVINNELDGRVEYYVVPVFELGGQLVEVAECASEPVAVVYGEPADMISADYNFADMRMQLVWTPSSMTDVLHYDLYRNGEKIASVQDTSYQDFGAELNTTYIYEVVVVREKGEDGPGMAMEVQTPELSAPQNLKVTYSDKKHTLTWDAVVGATGYDVCRKIGDGEEVYLYTTTDTTVQDTITDLTAEYAYRVFAVTEIAGKTFYSKPGDLVVIKHGEAAKFTKAKYDAAQQGVVLEWTKPEAAGQEITGYVIYKNGSKLETVSNTETYVDTDVKLGTTYTYGIDTLYGESMSKGASVEVSLDYLTAVTNLGIRYFNVTVDVLWNPVENAQKYEVYRSVNGGAYTLLEGETKTDASGRVIYSEHVERNTKYQYKVQPVVEYADGTVSRGAATTTDVVEIGDVPVLLSAKQSFIEGGVVLEWKASTKTDVRGYNIFRDGRSLGTVDAKATSYVDTTAEYGVTYTYSVSVMRKYGEDGPSNEISVTPEELKPVESVTATYEDNKTFLTWTLIHNADFYDILRVNPDNSRTPVGSTEDLEDPSVNTWTDATIEDVTAADTFEIASAAYVLDPVTGKVSVEIGAPPAKVTVTRGPKPVVVTPVLAQGGVSVSWDAINSDKLLSVKVLRNGTEIAEITDGSNMVLDAAAKSGDVVTYKVIATYGTAEAVEGTMSTTLAPFTVPAYVIDVTENSDGTVTLDGVLGTPDAALVIPAAINGKTVSAIAPDAFKGNTTIKTVTIEAPVTEIPDGAFEGCTSLTSVVLPNCVEVIGVRAFADCTNLSSMTCID